MTSRFGAQAARNDIDNQSLAQKGEALKIAAADWADGMKTAVRGKAVQAGSATDTYVRCHPGRFIAGACLAGIAAGWFLGRGRRDKTSS